MADVDAEAGLFIADIPVSDPPWSPWLRLAHLSGYAGNEPGAPLRRLRDWEMVLQLSGESWVWWERLRASEPLLPGHLLLIPPGEAHTQGPIGNHIAVHFDLAAQPQLIAFDMLEPLGGERRRADGAKRLG